MTMLTKITTKLMMTKAKENHRGQCRQGWVRTKPRFCISPASCRSTGSPCRTAPGVPTITFVIILITIRDTFLCRSMSRNYSCQSPAHWRSCQTFCQKCLHFVSPEMKTSQIFLSGKKKKLGETGSFFSQKEKNDKIERDRLRTEIGSNRGHPDQEDEAKSCHFVRICRRSG